MFSLSGKDERPNPLFLFAEATLFHAVFFIITTNLILVNSKSEVNRFVYMSDNESLPEYEFNDVAHLTARQHKNKRVTLVSISIVYIRVSFQINPNIALNPEHVCKVKDSLTWYPAVN